MSRRRGLTLVELMATLMAVVMALTGAFAVMLGSLKSFQRTQAGVSVAQPNSQAIRRVVDSLRGAMTVAISNSGRTITYTLPRQSSTVDPVTGERELI
jgi:Tfp pilus assembly protein PilW